jgi:hypothetical protein
MIFFGSHISIYSVQTYRCTYIKPLLFTLNSIDHSIEVHLTQSNSIDYSMESMMTNIHINKQAN